MASLAAVGRHLPAAAPAVIEAAAAAADGVTTSARRRDGSQARQERWTGMPGGACALPPRQQSGRRQQSVHRHRRQRRVQQRRVQQRHRQAAHLQPAALLAHSRSSGLWPRISQLGAGARFLRFSLCIYYRHHGRKPRRHPHPSRSANTPRRRLSRTIGRRLKEAPVEVPVRVMLPPIGKKMTASVLLHSSSARSNVRSDNSQREA